jgi:hypothetical protein
MADAFQEFLAQVATKPVEKWGDELLARIEEPCHLDDVTMVAIRVE